jgi:4-hydroxymandelate oxidase
MTEGPALQTIGEFEKAAAEKLSPMAFEYLQCGVGDEISLKENEAAFQAIKLNPRVCVNVSAIDTSLELFGVRRQAPILLAPTGYHKLFHPSGELETARGAALAQTELIAASFSTVAFEEMAGECQGLSFQLYFQPRRANTEELVNRVLEAGCKCIYLTVDMPVNGPRDRERRAGFALPNGIRRANLTFLEPEAAGASHRGQLYNGVRAADADWRDVEWLRSLVPVPLIVKGIMNADDANRAIECGCDGIVVSNHGARTVDTVPSTIEVLPEIAERVAKRVPILLDGGIRRGTDIFKALALGAAAILIGRPYIYGLAVAGAQGVSQVVQILALELAMTMGLTGCKNLGEIGRERLRN